MANTAYLINNVERTKGPQGIELSAQFYVPDADKTTYDLEIGSFPSLWIPSDLSTRLDIRVRSVKFMPLGPSSWICTQIANNYPSNDGMNGNSPHTERESQWSYKQKEMLVDPAWIGARLATKNDDANRAQFKEDLYLTATLFALEEKKKCNVFLHYLDCHFGHDTKFIPITVPTGETPAPQPIYDTDGILAKEGDYLYKNATPAEYIIVNENDGYYGYFLRDCVTDDNYQGDPVYTLSPFTHTTTFVALPEIRASLGQKIVTTIATVVFYTPRRGSKPNQFLTFVGVNPGDQTGGFPRHMRAPVKTGGIWKALDQSMSPMVDAAGEEWFRVTRTMQLAPNIDGVQLLWDPDKNGGVWSW